MTWRNASGGIVPGSAAAERALQGIANDGALRASKASRFPRDAAIELDGDADGDDRGSAARHL